MLAEPRITEARHVPSPDTELHQAQADRIRAGTLACARPPGQGHRPIHPGPGRRGLRRSPCQISPSGLAEGSLAGKRAQAARQRRHSAAALRYPLLLETGEDPFQRRDDVRPLALLQIEQDLETVALL